MVPSAADLPQIDPKFATKPNTADGDFMPYLRDERGARPWALPGTPGLEHRVGGLEKEDASGNISYDPENHQRMTDLRAAKVAGVDVPDLEVDDPSGEAELLVLGWGSTYGPIGGAVRRVRHHGGKVATAHLRHLNPLPRNTADVLRAYPRVLVPETNMGQLVKIVRAEFLVDAESMTKMKGLPFFTEELEHAIEERVR
jgi:2-oxoglutarate ferredoxin oxidoreductase subunit alpha